MADLLADAAAWEAAAAAEAEGRERAAAEEVARATGATRGARRLGAPAPPSSYREPPERPERVSPRGPGSVPRSPPPPPPLQRQQREKEEAARRRTTTREGRSSGEGDAVELPTASNGGLLFDPRARLASKFSGAASLAEALRGRRREKAEGAEAEEAEEAFRRRRRGRQLQEPEGQDRRASSFYEQGHRSRRRRRPEEDEEWQQERRGGGSRGKGPATASEWVAGSEDW